LKKNAYDNIILGEILEHQAAPRAVLREANRALRPGGRLVITTPVYPYLAQRSFIEWEQGLGNLAADKSVGEHVFEFTAGELRSLMEQMGFEILSFSFVDTRLWESRLCRFKESIPLPDVFYTFVDRVLILANRLFSPERLPKQFRVRHMIAVVICGTDQEGYVVERGGG
jgi:SAM-dependent methyltransferase